MSLSLINCSEISVFFAVFFSLSLLSDGEESQDKVLTVSGSAGDSREVFDHLEGLKNQLVPLVKKQETEKSAALIVESLLPVTGVLLEEVCSGLIGSRVRSVTKLIAQDKSLLPVLIRTISALEIPVLTKAVLFDSVGASEEASQSYDEVLASGENYPPAVLINQMRSSGRFDSEKISNWLARVTDNRRIEVVLLTVFHEARTFEECMALLRTLAQFLEEKESFQGDYYWLRSMEKLFGTRVYGEHQLPPLWNPDAAHSNGIKGIPSTPEMHEVRLRAYRRFCVAALQVPQQAAWAFSQLTALADLEGRFDGNSALLAYAAKALTTADEPTRLGSLGNKLTPPRFFSPELYLARAQWKGAEVPQFKAEIDERILLFKNLYAVEAEEFEALANQLVRDAHLIEAKAIGYWRGEEDENEKAYRRTREVLKIAYERGELARRVENTMALFVADPSLGFDWLIDPFLDQLDALVKSEGAVAVEAILERLAVAYMGSPEERVELIRSLPAQDVHYDYFVVPLVVKYVDFLNLMVRTEGVDRVLVRPALVFPALRKAEELGVLDRMSFYSWCRSEVFQKTPHLALQYLAFSPFVGEVAQFRVYPYTTGIQLHRSEKSVLDWILAEIQESDAEAKKIYLDYLKEEGAFGSRVILACLKGDGGKSLAKLLRSHTEEIQSLPEERRKELAFFVSERLLDEKLPFLETAIVAAKEDRLEKFKKELIAPVSGSGSSFISQAEALFLDLYRSDQGKALEALRLAVKLERNHQIHPSLHGTPSNGLRSRSIVDELLGLHFLLETGSTEFYLKVLADKELSPSLIVSERLLNARFPGGDRRVSQEKENLKNALHWLTSVYPAELPSEFFFISAFQRYSHVSSKNQSALAAPVFQTEVIASLPVRFRKEAEAGLVLGFRSHGWKYGDVSDSGGGEPEVEAAFKAVEEWVTNPALPFNLRLAIASLVCESCGAHSPNKLVASCLVLLVEGEMLGRLRSSDQEKSILALVERPSFEKDHRPLIDKFLALSREKNAVEEGGTEGVRRSASENIELLIGLAARSDEEEFKRLFEIVLEDYPEQKTGELLPLLIKAGKFPEALIVFERGRSWLLEQRYFSLDTFYDEEFAKNFAVFLPQVKNEDFRILLETYFNGLKSDPASESLVSSQERLIAIAKRVAKFEFEKQEVKRVTFRLLANEKAALPYLTNGFLQLVDVDQLPKILKGDRGYTLIHSCGVMMKGVLAGGEFEAGLSMLQKVEKQAQTGQQGYDLVLRELSKAILSSVTYHQDDPEALVKMLPITSQIAALSATSGLGESARAGNYARNIFCHALLDKMGEWKQWRMSLTPELRSELDEFWYDVSGWAIGLTKTRIGKKASLQQRFEVMKRILHQREIVGPRGPLHDKAMRHLHRGQFFSVKELKQIGQELVAGIPDSGAAKKQLGKALKE